MEKVPQFIKEFSKKESSGERQQAAQAIKLKRAEHFIAKRSQVERQEELQQATIEREQNLAEQLENIDKLKNELFELSTSGIGRVLNYFQSRKLRADILVGQKTYEELKYQQDFGVIERRGISEKLESKEEAEVLREARMMLDNFYKTQKKKWEESGYAKEDITKYFSEESLALLPLEDYILLLRRFPQEMVTHVTRQGIRDHIGHIYHTAGEGDYFDGFMKMVKDGRLRSPLGVHFVENEKERAIAKLLSLENFEDKEEALKHLERFTGSDAQDLAGSYADRMAVHFATEEVADYFYGSEKGNEIFVAYPSLFIASQYYFNGQLNKIGDGYWNDQWVWANEDRGMDLNVGLVFIPEETRVDKNSGSRYELDEKKNPKVNQELVASIQSIIELPEFFEFASQSRKILGRFNQRWTDDYIYPRNEDARRELEPLRLQLEKEFGIIDYRVQGVILDYDFLSRVLSGEEDSESKEKYVDTVESSIKKSLQDRGMLYGEAKNTVSSKEFWEDFFARNSNKRPSKIVYYKGDDPTKALWEWRKAQGLNKKSPDENFGFSERNVSRSAPQAQAGVGRFHTLAEKIIEDYFSQRGGS